MLGFSLVRGASSRRGPPPADPRFLWGPLSLLHSLRHPSCGCLSAGGMCTGADGRGFPVCDGLVSSRIVLNTTSFLPGCSAEPSVYLGGQTCFPGRDCVHLRVLCCIALFLLISTRSYCASTLWTDTAVGAGGGSRTGFVRLL